jgi:hypothetical protein
MGDADCRSWEVCSFAKPTDLWGYCTLPALP